VDRERYPDRGNDASADEIADGRLRVVERGFGSPT
jgi:hypothetical protein